jgi:hypothetical protein
MLGVYHPGPHRAGQVNGLPPCYDAQGNTCPQIMHIDKDHGNFTVSGTCYPGTWCTFTSLVYLGAAAQFMNTDFSCWANQTGGSYQYSTNFECYPETIQSFKLMWRNDTTAPIPAGTVMTISYAALGA